LNPPADTLPKASLYSTERSDKPLYVLLSRSRKSFKFFLPGFFLCSKILRQSSPTYLTESTGMPEHAAMGIPACKDLRHFIWRLPHCAANAVRFAQLQHQNLSYNNPSVQGIAILAHAQFIERLYIRNKHKRNIFD
jgi:hypothetical protein